MRLLPSLVLTALAALPAAAHEFWISPDAYTVAAGEAIAAELRVGDKFKGAGYAYIPQNFRRFELIAGDTAVPVDGTIGDRPALSQPAPDPGLVIIVHETKDYLLTYKDWETFANFTEHKDVPWAQARHLERGYTRDLVRERYSRYGKSLVAVGDGAGRDREVGLLTEVVALANPYTDDLSDGLPVRILYNGKPRADAQVEVFRKTPDDAVSIALYRTDAEGVAVVEATPGAEYLVDAVVMEEIEPDDPTGPVWESLWASLTFEVPARD